MCYDEHWWVWWQRRIDWDNLDMLSIKMRQTASSIVQQQSKGLRQTACLRQTWHDGDKQDVKVLLCYKRIHSFGTSRWRKSKGIKCVSRFATCKSHHTALSNAAAPNIDCHGRWLPRRAAASQWEMAHPRRNAAAVTPREPKVTKGGKTCPYSRPTRMQNFTALSFSAAEKSVNVQKKQN